MKTKTTQTITIITPKPWQGSIIVPAGRYYLGDPCYVIRDNDWIPLLENCNYFIDQPVGYIGGYEIVAFSTKHGDGVYFDKGGRKYGVDAGLIGLVPVAYGGREHQNREVEFESPTLCWNDDGVLHFGRITINTNLVSEDEDE